MNDTKRINFLERNSFFVIPPTRNVRFWDVVKKFGRGKTWRQAVDDAMSQWKKAEKRNGA